MKARSKPNRSKKLVLVRSSASQIRASLQVGPLEERRAKAALAAVLPERTISRNRKALVAKKRRSKKRPASAVKPIALTK